MRRTSLGMQLAFWLAIYTLLLSAAIVLHGYIVNERAESVVWNSLLESELDHFVDRRAQDPAARWADSEQMRLYGPGSPHALPAALAALPIGLHDELDIDGRKRIVLVQRRDGARYALSLDITAFEDDEQNLTLAMAGGAAPVVLLLVLLMGWGLRRLVRPLSELALSIGRLRPDVATGRLQVDPNASRELMVIADALNDYLARHERFVARERAFIDSASHELRTPIAVIAGASALALAQHGLPEAARTQVRRVQDTARNVERLVQLLLVLAKDPGRLAQSSDRVALPDLLSIIIADHLYLALGKDLVVSAGTLAACTVDAPMAILQAAIGNLLRNAIENSDRGEIRVSVGEDATVVIEDPGHGMSPEEISAIYSRLARGEGRDGGGIGLDLIARLCEHLGWALTFEARDGGGTTTRLALAPLATGVPAE